MNPSARAVISQLPLALCLLIYNVSAHADVPVRSPLEVRAHVQSVQGNTVVLTADSLGRPLAPDMLLTLLAGDRAAALVRIDAVRGGQATGTVTESQSDTPVPPGLAGVAPCPIPVTALDGSAAHLALPLDHGLTQGTLLRVFRDGTDIGAAALSIAEDQPPSAVLIEGGAKTLRPGDVCYAVPESVTLPIAQEAAPPTSPREPSSARPTHEGILVSAVDGGDVYLWAPEPDALAASMERLSIIRGGECIAVVRLSADGPLGGKAESIKPGTSIAAGDQARPWAETDAPQAPAVAEAGPQPPQVAQAPPDVTPDTDAVPRQPAASPEAPSQGPARTSLPTDRPKSPWTSPPLGLSLSGPTGLLRIPNAEVQPSGVVRLGRVFVSPDLDRSFPGSRSRSQFTIGALPRVELGLAHYARFLEDLTYHGKIQLLPERDHWPALAVGTMDVRAAYGLQPTRFLTLSKRLVDGRLRLTLGYGHGGLGGAFGGVEAAVTRQLTLLAEYDTEELNFGLRAAPTPRIHIDLADVSGTLGGQVTYAFVIDEEDAPPRPVILSRPSTPLSPQALADRLQEAVCALGMENVRAEVGEGPSGQTAVVFYENRQYLHDETEALGQVLAAAARELPPGVARLAAIATKSQVPVLRVVTQPDGYVRFLSGELAPERYAGMLQVDHSSESPIARSHIVGRSELGNPTRFTADLAVTPLVRTLIGTERPTPDDPGATQSLAVRFSLRPDLSINLGRGLDLRYSHGVHVAGALGMGIDPYYASDAAHATYVFEPVDGGLARLAAGDFLGGRRGALAEGVVELGGDRLLLRGLAGRLTDLRFFDTRSYHWVYVGDVRYRIPSIHLVASATAGRYVGDDTGFTLGLRKYFEDTELEMQFRHSDYGDVLLLAGTVPIGPRSWPKPDRVRLRLGDRVRFGQRALLPEGGEAGSVTAASMVANQLEEFDLTDALLNRDRLNAAYLRVHLDTLVRAAQHVVSAER